MKARHDLHPMKTLIDMSSRFGEDSHETRNLKKRVPTQVEARSQNSGFRMKLPEKKFDDFPSWQKAFQIFAAIF
jgi:hypothetical protein